MQSPSELSMAHGFEGPTFPDDFSGAFDEPGMHEAGIYRFSHGYMSAWESLFEQSLNAQADPGEQDEIPPSGFGQRSAATDDSESELLHGEEAAAWATLARRALLRRMDEE